MIRKPPIDLTKIDRQRMEEALSEKPIDIPPGLTREQKKDFILSANKKT